MAALPEAIETAIQEAAEARSKTMDVYEVELRRVSTRKGPDIDVAAAGPSSVVPLLRDILGGREQESFVILCLDIRNRVVAWREVARGSSVSVPVPVRD